MLSVILNSVGRTKIGLKFAESVITPLFLYSGRMVEILKISGFEYTVHQSCKGFC